MRFIIGTDEAGYGPNLGPLVVAATLWQVPDDVECLYEALEPVICKAGGCRDSAHQQKIPVGDSKTLYQSQGSLAALERGVLAMLGVSGGVPESFSELVRQVARPHVPRLDLETTYHWDEVNCPATCQRHEIDAWVMQVREAMADRDIQCLQLAATLVFPEEFNQGLNEFGNKASLLSTITCRLVRHLLDSAVPPNHNVLILGDKHGGRSRYAGWLQQELTDSLVRVMYEERESSCYRWQDAGRQLEASFWAKGERHLPVGLASMLAKYLRELSMDAWNRFWCDRMPDLQPTAGYPQDARRFKQEIATVQSQLDVADRLIWRQR